MTRACAFGSSKVARKRVGDGPAFCGRTQASPRGPVIVAPLLYHLVGPQFPLSSRLYLSPADLMTPSVAPWSPQWPRQRGHALKSSHACPWVVTGRARPGAGRIAGAVRAVLQPSGALPHPAMLTGPTASRGQRRAAPPSDRHLEAQQPGRRVPGTTPGAPPPPHHLRPRVPEVLHLRQRHAGHSANAADVSFLSPVHWCTVRQ